MNKVLASVLAPTFIVFSLPGAASQVNWQFTGIVNQGNFGGTFFPIAVAPGDSMKIDLTLQTDTPCAICGATSNSYNDPLTAISFIDNDNGKTFAFPLTSSTVFLTKDEAPGPGGKFFLTQFEVDFAGQDSSSEIDYAGGLLLANAALMPPVPGINDVHLANLAPPDPAAFPNSFLGFETNNFSVVAIPLGDGTFDNSFSGQLLTSSAAVAPEFDAASTGAALTLLFGGLAVLRSRRSRRI